MATTPSTIKFELGSTPATITLTQGELELSNTSESISITGLGADDLTVSGGGASRVFQIDPGVTASISGLTVSGGSASFAGGGLYNQGMATLTGVNVIGNYAGYHGGGLFNSGTATLTDCVIRDNSTPIFGIAPGGVGGGGVENDGTATLTDCTISGNSAFLGSGLKNDPQGSLSLINCPVTENSDGGGGAIWNLYGALTMTGSTLGDNSGSGGLLIRYATATLTDCTISGNSGSGVAAFSGTVDLTGCSIEDNGRYGVGSGGTTTMTDCTVSGNSGCGVSIGGTASLTDCTISDNSNKNAFLVGGAGGGVANGGTATLTDCTISGNSAIAANHDYPYSGVGGGLYNSGTATLIDCTISDNSAIGVENYPGTGNGGGIFNEGPGTYVGPGKLALIACTVTGNSATNIGGGLYNYSYTNVPAYCTLTDSIIAANTAPSGPSDITGNDAADVTGSSNLIGTGGWGGLTAANNLLNVANPGLAPLGDYGGPTETIALEPNSPAIGAGTAVPGVTTDQRGFPLDNSVDIGAFQSQPGPLVVDTAIDGIGSSLGQLSLRQAVKLANVLDGGDAITFDKSVFKKATTITLTDGPLEISNTTGPISITGTSAAKLTISGGGTMGVFQVDAGATATISNLTIAGGVTTGNGGGLLNDGTTTLFNVVIGANAALDDGGGVYNSGSLFASNVTVAGNTADNGGGIDNAGTAVMLLSSIDGNFATADGGGIDNSGFLSLERSVLSANSAVALGGGLFDIGTATLLFCTVDHNAASSGGGLYVDPSTKPAVLVWTTVTGNKGGNIFGRVIKL